MITEIMIICTHENVNLLKNIFKLLTDCCRNILAWLIVQISFQKIYAAPLHAIILTHMVMLHNSVQLHVQD